MATLRLKGAAAGSDMGLFTGTVGSNSGSVTINTFRLPLKEGQIPRIIGPQAAGDTLTIDAGDLTLTGYQWQELDDGTWNNIPGATASSYDTTGGAHGQKYLRCVCPEGTTPPILVYRPMSSALMARDDADVVALVPQEDATHIAVTDGNWISPTTWLRGEKPWNGARVFIPYGRTVTYDESSTDIRLDSIRVDGKLTVDHSANRHMKVYNFVITRGGEFECGTGAARVPANITHTFEISNRYYRTDARRPTDLDMSGSDPRLLGCGILSQGSRTMWGAEKPPWLKTRCEFTLDTTLDGAAETSVALTETIPTTLAASGVFQVIDDDGEYIDLTYSSYSGSTLTITSANFSTVNATAGNAVYISFAPMTGDTSVTLADTPDGWAVGDEILIGSTQIPAGPDFELVTNDENEIRIITAVNGNVVSWSAGEPLLYDHDHHNNAVTRADLQPGIANLTRNIVIKSEDASVPNWQRGHTMDMHMYCKADIWDVRHEGLGRTFRARENQTNHGFIDENDDFYALKFGSPAAYPKDSPQINVLSRYPLHAHKVGFNKSFLDIYSNCVVVDTPGWGIAHHDCELAANDNVIFDFSGAGMAAENGSETGDWVGNFVCGARYKQTGLQKQVNSAYGEMGSGGQAFYCAARTVRINSNMAQNANCGFGFYHRFNNSSVIPAVEPTYANLDVKDFMGVRNWGDTVPSLDNYPIIHLNDNETAGCSIAFSVTKGGPAQLHNLAVNIQRFKSWNCWMGLNIEYVAQYILTDADVVAGNVADTRGLITGGNTHNISFVRPRTEGFDIGCQFNTASTAAIDDTSYNNTDNPRFLLVAHTSINDVTPYDVSEAAGQPAGDDRVEAVMPPIVETSTDYPTIPSPAAIRRNNWYAQRVTATKTDTSGPGPLPLSIDNIGMLSDNTVAGKIDIFGQTWGAWTITGQPYRYIIFPMYFSDRVTGIPVKSWHCIEGEQDWSLVGVPTRGNMSVASGPPVVSPANINTPFRTSATIDILALATHPDGANMYLSDSFIQADHGRIEINSPNPGEVTFTPDRWFRGTDVARVWVQDGADQVLKAETPVDQPPTYATRVDIAITVT